MNPQEALKVLTDASSLIVANKQVHIAVEQALAIISAVINQKDKGSGE